jgi:hypothetical protein
MNPIQNISTVCNSHRKNQYPKILKTICKTIGLDHSDPVKWIRKVLTGSEHIFEKRGLTPMPEFFRCHMHRPGRLSKRPATLSVFMSDLMTYADMLLRMHHVQAHPWKLCQRYCCAIRIYQLHKGTWVKSVMLRPCGGLTTSMGDSIYGRTEDLFSARLFQGAIAKDNCSSGIHYFSGP